MRKLLLMTSAMVVLGFGGAYAQGNYTHVEQNNQGSGSDVYVTQYGQHSAAAVYQNGGGNNDANIQQNVNVDFSYARINQGGGYNNKAGIDQHSVGGLGDGNYAVVTQNGSTSGSQAYIEQTDSHDYASVSQTNSINAYASVHQHTGH